MLKRFQLTINLECLIYSHIYMSQNYWSFLWMNIELARWTKACVQCLRYSTSVSYLCVKQEQKWVSLKSDSSALYMHLKQPVSTIENEESVREWEAGTSEPEQQCSYGNRETMDLTRLSQTPSIGSVYKPLQVHHKQTAKNKPAWFDSGVKTNDVRVAEGHRINSWSKNGFQMSQIKLKMKSFLSN